MCVCGWISYGGWCCFGLLMAPNRGLVSNYPGYRGMANRLQDVHWPVSCSSAGQSNTHRRVRKYTHKKSPIICYWAVIHFTFCPGCCAPKLYLVPWNIRWKNIFSFLIQVKGFSFCEAFSLSLSVATLFQGWLSLHTSVKKIWKPGSFKGLNYKILGSSLMKCCFIAL